MRMMKHHHFLTLQFDEKIKMMIVMSITMQLLIEVITVLIQLVVMKLMFPRLQHLSLDMCDEGYTHATHYSVNITP